MSNFWIFIIFLQGFHGLEISFDEAKESAFAPEDDFGETETDKKSHIFSHLRHAVNKLVRPYEIRWK